jgi:hypothetical protein
LESRESKLSDGVKIGWTKYKLEKCRDEIFKNFSLEILDVVSVSDWGHWKPHGLPLLIDD